MKKSKAKVTKTDPVEKVTVEKLLSELEHASFDIKEQLYCSLSSIYKKKFVEQSIFRCLIDTKSLALAGNGTPVVTAHREHKHRICDCASKSMTDCKCDRYFSQPDYDIGWDSFKWV